MAKYSDTPCQKGKLTVDGVYREIKALLEEEPILREEFEELKQFLKKLEDFSGEEFNTQYEMYQEFIDFLLEIASIPKNKRVS